MKTLFLFLGSIFFSEIFLSPYAVYAGPLCKKIFLKRVQIAALSGKTTEEILYTFEAAEEEQVIEEALMILKNLCVDEVTHQRPVPYLSIADREELNYDLSQELDEKAKNIAWLYYKNHIYRDETHAASILDAFISHDTISLEVIKKLFHKIAKNYIF